MLMYASFEKNFARTAAKIETHPLSVLARSANMFSISVFGKMS